MSNPALLDVTEATLPQMLDVNALLHETVFTALLNTGVIVPHYPLWIDRPDEGWLEVHYREHQSWSNALNLGTPPDLGTLDIQDEQQFQQWLVNHAGHHTIVSQALGLDS